MGDKGAATSSISPSPSPSSAALCCMCGDHGLTQELFRCKVCQFRSQHKYCSDLYPKEEQYRVCNWCIRGDGGRSSARATATATANNIISASSSTTSGGASGGSLGGGVMLHRGSLSTLVNEPIKKQRAPKRSASDVTEEMRSAGLSPVTIGRKRQAFRGKARRYKLLEEVSS